MLCVYIIILSGGLGVCVVYYIIVQRVTHLT